MGKIRDTGRAAWPRTPAGAEPDKDDIADFVDTVDAKVTALELSQNGGSLAYETRDDLYGNTTAAAGVKAEVWGDADAGKNGVYSSDGSGTGASRWTRIAGLNITGIANDLADLSADVVSLTSDVDSKAPLNNPNFTGNNVRAPTAPAGDSSTKIANTSWVQDLVAPFDRGQVLFTQGGDVVLNSAAGTILTVTTELSSTNVRRPRQYLVRWPAGAETNFGPLTIIINGTYDLPANGPDDLPIAAGDMQGGSDYIFYYDGNTLRWIGGTVLPSMIGKMIAPVTPPSAFLPGHSPFLFSSSISGTPEANAAFRFYARTVDTDGRVIRITGSETIAPIDLFRMEPNRRHKLRFVVRRRTDTDDPLNDAVRLAVVWLDRNGVSISTSTFTDLALEVGDGRVEVSKVIARSAASGVDVVAPSNAVYYRPFVQTYGERGVTDVEVISPVDITDAAYFAPNLTALESRVSAVESLNAGSRIAALEALIDAPRKQTFETLAAAAAVTPTETTNIIELLGYHADGIGGGRYIEAAEEPADHDAWFTTADGRVWVHADPVIDIAQLGAVVDGETDESGFIEKLIRAGAALRKPMTAFMAGVLMASTVQIENVGAVDLRLTLGPSLLIQAIAETDPGETQKILTLDSGVSDAYAKPHITIEGGHFNNADLAYGNPAGDPWDQGGGDARGACLGLTRYQYSVRNVTFQGGSNYFDENGTYVDQTVVGGDNGLTLINCLQGEVIGCSFYGQPDSGIYPRHDDNTLQPGICRVISCFFYRCHAAVHAKHMGGQLIFSSNDARECRQAIHAWADYWKPGSLTTVPAYQPFSVAITGNKFHKIAQYVADCERCQTVVIQGNELVDWGRRLDGLPDTSQNRQYTAAYRIRGCMDFNVLGNTARLRDWDGGEAEVWDGGGGAPVVARFLVFCLVESDDAGDGTAPTLASRDGLVALNSMSCVPVDYNAGTGRGAEVTDAARIGGFAMMINRGPSGSARYIFNHCPLTHVVQKYRFNNPQVVIELPETGVASPDGSPWDGNMLGVWSNGLLSTGAKKVVITGDSAGADGTASPVRFEVADTDAGSSWDLTKPFVSYDLTSGDGNGAGLGTRGRMGLVMEGATGGQSSLVFQTTTLVADGLTTRGRFTSDGWFVLSQPAGTKAPPNNGDLLFEVTNNTTVTVKLKGTDGTVRSTTLTLS